MNIQGFRLAVPRTVHVPFACAGGGRHWTGFCPATRAMWCKLSWPQQGPFFWICVWSNVQSVQVSQQFYSPIYWILVKFWSNLCKMASNRVSLIVVVQSMACWTHCTFASRTCHHLFCWPLPQANELHYVQEIPAVTLGNNLIQAQLSHSSLAARLGKVIQYDTVTIWLPWMDSWKGITCACNITWSHQRQFGDLVRIKGNQKIFWTIHD